MLGQFPGQLHCFYWEAISGEAGSLGSGILRDYDERPVKMVLVGDDQPVESDLDDTNLARVIDGEMDGSEELRRRMFRVSSNAPGAANTGNNSVTLRFTAQNWFMPQTVIVEAPNDATASLDEDDDALEGTRTGVINHVVTSLDTIEGSPTTVLGASFTDVSKTFPVDGLRGRTLEIVAGRRRSRAKRQ